MNSLKRILLIYLVLILSLPAGAFAEQIDAWVEPLAVGRNVKIALKDGNRVVGKLKSWDARQIVVEDSKQGEITFETERAVKATYILGEITTGGETTFRGVKSEGTSAPTATRFSNPAIPVESGSTAAQLNLENNKQDWQRRMNGARALQVFEIIAGLGGTIGGGYMWVDGDNQRRNAKIVLKGYYITNEDDVNAGNEKVLYGSVILALGITVLVLGISQGNNVHNLEYEGQQRGFSVSLENEDQYCGLKVSWKY